VTVFITESSSWFGSLSFTSFFLNGAFFVFSMISIVETLFMFDAIDDSFVVDELWIRGCEVILLKMSNTSC